ncbi:putative threonine synthase [Trypanosoma rangeli]|uniref:Putative threonine synthase n=1 Tax=Trypanosoma rangeli TaxID=5698 RepID=A0A422NX69_TRYRA|nr:putative threonine synthase [Trypanosoma rangeli]RNF10077.1 putative threonine synthase [Trypanosoma rangeli]|eukprot:RNF10077.1 putative threonine synthase [Trypanosoma rangeli]
MILLHVTGSAPVAAREDVERALLAAYVPTRFTLHPPHEAKKEGAAAAAAASSFRLLLEAHDAPLVSPQAVPYDCRFFWTPTSTTAEVVEEVTSLLDGRRFTSTRGAIDMSTTFLTVVRNGLAPDSGLYSLRRIPKMTASQLRYFCTNPALSYVEGAQLVLERLVDATMQPATLHMLLAEAYAPARWSGRGNVCPVTPLLLDGGANAAGTPHPAAADAGVAAAPDIHWSGMSLLELYHGPTAAFKDFALQLFPRYFDIATAHACHAAPPSYIILTATSGDTGVAAISGFVNAGSPSRVMVLYPLHGVSPVQQIQMLSYDDGASVRVYGVKSDFDFCQSTVKHLFANRSLAQRLWGDAGVRLSSANSINWGRLIPQVVYYFWAYRHFVQQRQLRLGDPLDVVVPCGNFGNILAAFLAKRMGLSLGTLVVASNCNDVLFEFVRTGHYDVRQRRLVPTASPSIDILKASNVERFLFLLADGDAAFVAAQMRRLETEGHFALEGDALAVMRKEFWSARCTEQECAATIKAVYEASAGRLLDPHTAVAVFAARQFRLFQLEHGVAPRPLVIASTAHWAKFPGSVLRALRGEDMAHDISTRMAKTPGEGAAEDSVRTCRGLYNEILAQCPQVAVHPALNAALTVAETKTMTPRDLAADVSCVEEELLKFVTVNSA